MQKWRRINYLPNQPLGHGNEIVTASEAHITLSKNAAKEGMVLLKNNGNLLPLAYGTKVALFGKGTFDYVKGGGGSGDVTVEYIRNIYDGFKSLSDRVSVFEDTVEFYREYVRNAYLEGKEPGLVPEPVIEEGMIKKAYACSDVAVVSFCRFSGEGWDRKSKSDGEGIHAESWVEKYAKQSDELFENGDFYLSNEETTLIESVKKVFDQVIVVMNVGGMVDTNWFVADDQIQSVLMAWQAGMEGGTAIAELLCGIGNPSGKLVDTFAKALEDYPSTYNYHESKDYIDYTEDIYVGYRYFETINEAKEKVNYPFGYGLSYTTFDWNLVDARLKDDKIEMVVDVTNTGSLEGREVIQAYVMAPQGKLDKPAKSLVAFMKTRNLLEGETQRLLLDFDTGSMASYDDLGKVKKSAYILEKGTYQFFVGSSVRDGLCIDFTYYVDEDIIVKQLSEKIAPTALKKRMLADGSYEQLEIKESNDPNATVIPGWEPVSQDGMAPAAVGSKMYHHAFRPSQVMLMDVAEGKETLDTFMAALTDEALAHLLGGQPNVGVANTWGIGNLPDYGVPNVMTADGPAGLRIVKEREVTTTAWPCSTLLASTWDDALVFEVGLAGAKEVKENNLGMWLTPAINIHRSPLCGRNFEYYSEDPYLTGQLAAAMVRGIQSVGVSASVKHFALNNKETNRKNSDSRVSERAAREIYLKAFEIVVKEADPWCIMSSYNIINGHRASENKELLEDILRDEWGYNGLVTTDWWTYGEHYKEVLAGNDVKMACGYPERLKQAMEAGVLTRNDLEHSARRVLELILKLD